MSIHYYYIIAECCCRKEMLCECCYFPSTVSFSRSESAETVILKYVEREIQPFLDDYPDGHAVIVVEDPIGLKRKFKVKLTYPNFGSLTEVEGSVYTFEKYQMEARRTTNLDQSLEMRLSGNGSPKIDREIAEQWLKRQDLSNAGLGLSGEVGEVSELLKKHFSYGEKLDVAKLKEELGDVMWYLAFLASVTQLNLADIAKENIEKLRIRYPNGFSQTDAATRPDLEEKPYLSKVEIRLVREAVGYNIGPGVRGWRSRYAAPVGSRLHAKWMELVRRGLAVDCGTKLLHLTEWTRFSPTQQAALLAGLTKEEFNKKYESKPVY